MKLNRWAAVLAFLVLAITSVLGTVGAVPDRIPGISTIAPAERVEGSAIFLIDSRGGLSRPHYQYVVKETGTELQFIGNYDRTDVLKPWRAMVAGILGNAKVRFGEAVIDFPEASAESVAAWKVEMYGLYVEKDRTQEFWDAYGPIY